VEYGNRYIKVIGVMIIFYKFSVRVSYLLSILSAPHIYTLGHIYKQSGDLLRMTPAKKWQLWKEYT